MTRRRGTELVPARPFADWLDGRLDQLGRQLPKEQGAVRDLLSPQAMLCVRIGWGDTPAAIRRLNRYRRMVRSSRAGQPDVPTDVFERAVVEEALHRAGVLFEEVYPPERFPGLVVDGPMFDVWCGPCGERVTVGGDGVCPWCESPARGLAA